jgi:membrane-associated phospholipid phosphatase
VRAIYAVVAALALVVFFALGVAATRSGEPTTLLGWEQAMRGHSALIAWWLTWSCYPYVLAPIGVILLLVAWRVPSWRGRILFSIVTLLLCWQLADVAQHHFMRPRRLDWVVKHESAFSYPSSHAAIAVGFYALWAGMLWFSDLPRRVRAIAGAGLLVLAVAICWSRLALGAHYVTDLVGGALLAMTLVSAGLAIVPVKVFAPTASPL